MKKYLFIIGIALVLSSIVGYIQPTVRYFKPYKGVAREISKKSYEATEFAFKRTEINLPLVFLVFIATLGTGLIIISISFKGGNIDPLKKKLI